LLFHLDTVLVDVVGLDTLGCVDGVICVVSFISSSYDVGTGVTVVLFAL
tara:strand:- start:693 stop:839 length:147 start_codon:yes stop_codon:yes gene_type:complete